VGVVSSVDAGKLASLCELLERRFEEKAKKSDMLDKVRRYVSGSRMRMHKMSRVLYEISVSGSLSASLFKYFTVRLFASSWLDSSVAGELAGEQDEGWVDNKKVSIVERFVSSCFGGGRIANILNLLDYYRVIGMTPIAYRIFLAYLSRYSSREKRKYEGLSVPYVYQGARLILSSELGSGKTTMAFASLYSFFRALDFSHGDSYKLAIHFFANTLREAVWLAVVSQAVAEEGLLIPAVVVDDVGAFMSKYKTVPGLADMETRRMITAFMEYYQISREGIGCNVVISAPEMAPKGIRTTADAVITGYSIKDREVYTMWIETANFLKPAYRPRDDTTPPLIVTRVLRGATATVHPPLVLPPEISSILTQKKLEHRRKLLDEMMDALLKEKLESGDLTSSPP
jgi:hypothetical protein